MTAMSNLKSCLAGLVAGFGGASYLYFSAPPLTMGVLDDPALTGALFSVADTPLAESNCGLAEEEGAEETVANFLTGYFTSTHEKVGGKGYAECGGRGEGLCSLSYSVQKGEHADAKMLLFVRDEDGSIKPDGVTCIAP